MPAWEDILRGAVVTAVACAVGLALIERPRQPRRLLAGGAAAFAGPLAWYGVLRRMDDSALARELSGSTFPASWSDVGAALTTFAAVALVLGLGPDRRVAAQRVQTAALGCAVAAFGIAVYVT